MSDFSNGMLKNNVDLGSASLTPPDNEDSKDTQNPDTINQYNAGQNEIIILSEYDKSAIIVIPCFLTCFIIVLFIVLYYLIKFDAVIYAIAFIALMILTLMISLFSLLYRNVKKRKLIKNESCNLLTVKEINFFGCSKSTFNFKLNNVIPDIINYSVTDEDTVSSYEALVIANTFKKNDIDIDLTLSDIKNKPIKELYHVFPEIKKSTYTPIGIRNFIGISPEIENPTQFNISKYMGKQSGASQTFSHYQLSKCMKMSDYFYSYYFNVPSCYCEGYLCLIITVSLTLIYIIWPFIILFTYDNVDVLATVIVIIVMLVIPSIIVLFNIIAINKYTLRMDIIYTNNFDTIFIAFLNHNGNSYKKTFIHAINSIERFIIESYNNSNDKSILKVVYKDKTFEDIFRIDESKYNLDGLLFILNEKINNSSYQQI